MWRAVGASYSAPPRSALYLSRQYPRYGPHDEARIPPAPFNAAHISQVNLRPEGKFFLGHLLLMTIHVLIGQK